MRFCHRGHPADGLSIGRSYIIAMLAFYNGLMGAARRFMGTYEDSVVKIVAGRVVGKCSVSSDYSCYPHPSSRRVMHAGPEPSDCSFCGRRMGGSMAEETVRLNRHGSIRAPIRSDAKVENYCSRPGNKGWRCRKSRCWSPQGSQEQLGGHRALEGNTFQQGAGLASSNWGCNAGGDKANSPTDTKALGMTNEVRNAASG